MSIKKMIVEKLNATVKKISDLLAEEKYAEMEALCNGIRLNAWEITSAVTEYGRKIIPLPQKGYEKIDIIEVPNSNPREWSVNVPLYTSEEGLSDLTLELTLIDSPSSLYKIEVDDLHVL